MLNLLFKPKWKNKNPKVRLEGVAELDPADGEQRQLLCQMAREDSDADVRLVACKKLDDAQLAFQRYHLEANDEIKRYFGQLILASLQKGESIATTIEQVYRFIENDAPTSIVEQLARTAKNPDLRKLALSKIERESICYDIVVGDSVHELRQMALDKIKKRKTLERLLKQVRNKDKNVTRIIKDRLSAMDEAIKAPKILEEKVTQACTLLEASLLTMELKKASHQVEKAKAIWQDVSEEIAKTPAELNNEITSRYHRAIEKSDKHLSHLQQVEDELRQAKEKYAALLQENERVLAAMAELKQRCWSENYQLSDSLEAIDNELTKLVSGWSISKELPASEAKRLTLEFEALKKNIRQFISSLPDAIELKVARSQARKSLDEVIEQRQQGNTDLRFGLKALSDLRAKWNVRANYPWDEGGKSDTEQFIQDCEDVTAWLKQRETDWKERVARIKEALPELESAIKEGKLKDAQARLASINSLANKIPQALMRPVAKRLANARNKVNEWKDWHTFAADPQKTALLEVMQQLVDKPKPPEEQAELVREARQMWGTLTKARTREERELTAKFNALAEKAYAPCRGFYQEKAEERESNYQKRLAFCQSIESYGQSIDWDSYDDWEGLEKRVTTYRKDWAELGATDRKHRKALQKQFHDLVAVLEEKIIGHRKANSRDKVEIIERAKKLLDIDDVRIAVEEAKKLQQDWKKVGRALRGEDGRLWKEFRGICDAIFDKRAKQSAEFKQQLSSQLDKANELLGQLEQILRADEEAFAESCKGITAIVHEWEQVGDVPKAMQSKINNRYRQLIDKLERRQITAQNKSQYLSLLELVEGDAICEAIESDIANGELTAAQVQSYQEKWDGLDDLIRAQLSQRFESALEGDVVGADEEVLASLCLRMEVIADIESPQQYKQARMAYQVERLSSALVEGASEGEGRFEQGLSVIKLWLKQRAKSKSPQLSRFEKAQKAWLEQFVHFEQEETVSDTDATQESAKDTEAKEVASEKLKPEAINEG